MLSEEYIDNLIQPIITRQEEIGVNTITTIAKRLKSIGALNPDDLNRLKILYQMGGDIRQINSMLAQQAGLQIKDIKKVIKTVAQNSYIDAKPFYDYRHKSSIPLEKNTELSKILKAVSRRTQNTYINISDTRAIGFTVQQGSKIVFKPLVDAYQQAIDEAILAIESGLDSYETVVRRTIQQLLNSGLRRVYWESGYSKRLDSAVRQAIHDGIKQLHLEMEAEMGKQFGADGWQLSAHMYSAPDHEPFQGHSFTLEEFDKLQNNEDFTDTWGIHFKGVKRIIGQWNCRHWARAVILGQHSFAYKPETLKRYKEENDTGYRLPNGKKLTMYECTQYQREMETKIRQEKIAQMAAQAAGDKESALKHQAKVSTLIKEYEAFSKDCGLKPKRDRIKVTGYKRISIK